MPIFKGVKYNLRARFFVGNFCFDFIVVFEFFSFLGLVGGGGLEGVLQATISVMVTSPCG